MKKQKTRSSYQHLSACSCSRRSFLRGSGLTLTGFGISSLFPTPFIEHAMASAPTGRRLLFIFLRGGNDGINAVIPHGDPDYSLAIRPTLYVPDTTSIDLNGWAHLHPKLSDLMDIFNDDELAVIHRVGYANNSRSHFDGQRIWENGDPTQTQLFEGWLYRYVRDHAVSAGLQLPVLSVQDAPPILLRGDEKFVNIANPSSFEYNIAEPLRTKYEGEWREHYSALLGLEQYRPVLSQTGVKLMDILDTYSTWDEASWNPTDPISGDSLFPVDDLTNPDDPSGPGGKKFSPQSYEFFHALKICALSLLESDAGCNGTRITGTELGGWDTHNSQGGEAGVQAERLHWLGYGMRSLKIVLSGTATDPRNYPPIWDSTVVATLSEFGRTTDENGSQGTDHGAASCQFVAGGLCRRRRLQLQRRERLAGRRDVRRQQPLPAGGDRLPGHLLGAPARPHGGRRGQRRVGLPRLHGGQSRCPGARADPLSGFGAGGLAQAARERFLRSALMRFLRFFFLRQATSGQRLQASALRSNF